MAKDGESSSTTTDANAGSRASAEFVAGVIASAAGLIVGQPFDVVKVRYQTPEYAGRYASVAGAFRSIVREERVQGLFKGVMSPMAGIAFINGVVFTSYSVFMRMQLPQDDSEEPSLAQICLAGAGSGLAGSQVPIFQTWFLTCPTELVKIRQQSAPPHLNLSILDVCRGIIRTDGLRGIYRGFSATALRDLAYGPYFGTYEAICRYFRSRQTPPEERSRHHHESLIEEAEQEIKSLSWSELMIAGGVAGVTAWAVTFPLDVIKTRMQATDWAGGNVGQQSPTRPSKPGLWQVARSAVRAEGWRVMYAGLAPTLIRAVPVNMVTFVVYEACVANLVR